MSCSCCSCGESGEKTSDNSHRYPYGQDEGNVTEKHYGCYKVGILFSIIIILLLLVGCVPVFFLTHNNNLILLILLVTLILIGIVTYAYFRWQHRRAQQMRRSYEVQKMNLTRTTKRPDPTEHKQVQPNPGTTKIAPDNGNSIPANQPRYSFI
ncbi:uncharacterized protein LOC131436334 [Malaya genurostris]|uniref:uncharacterized protein LOC131436334 n=1 Tax=Malaya genurostris TaxID=325434 RepID=UPI0026F3D55C|nr:uncharacterized protein LOC131436334 [Malaya genurostris]